RVSGAPARPAGCGSGRPPRFGRGGICLSSRLEVRFLVLPPPTGRGARSRRKRRVRQPFAGGTAAVPKPERRPSPRKKDLAGCGDGREDLGEVHLERLDLAALATDLLDRLIA